MKNTKLFASLLGLSMLFLFACGNNEDATTEKAEEAQQEVAQELDSMSGELDSAKQTLEQNTEALIKALDALN
ncbi:MAG: hypothetical protein R2769_02100 [Saprospiraceae bacterium]